MDVICIESSRDVMTCLTRDATSSRDATSMLRTRINPMNIEPYDRDPVIVLYTALYLTLDTRIVTSRATLKNSEFRFKENPDFQDF
jgi:hypothetical protein